MASRVRRFVADIRALWRGAPVSALDPRLRELFNCGPAAPVAFAPSASRDTVRWHLCFKGGDAVELMDGARRAVASLRRARGTTPARLVLRGARRGTHYKVVIQPAARGRAHYTGAVYAGVRGDLGFVSLLIR